MSVELATLFSLLSVLAAVTALYRAVNKAGVESAVEQEKRFARIEADIHDIKVGMGICRRATDCPMLKIDQEKPP